MRPLAKLADKYDIKALLQDIRVPPLADSIQLLLPTHRQRKVKLNEGDLNIETHRHNPKMNITLTMT